MNKTKCSTFVMQFSLGLFSCFCVYLLITLQNGTAGKSGMFLFMPTGSCLGAIVFLGKTESMKR